MPGFGSGSFGSGPFGRFGWSEQVLYRDLPAFDRAVDLSDNEGRMQKFTQAIRPGFDFLLKKASDFGTLRDTDTVRTQRNEVLNVTIDSSAAMGRVIAVTFHDPDPNDPFAPLQETSCGWILKDSTGREYTVNAVHKLRPNVVDVVGIAELPTTGAATLRPPSLIELLGADYGIDVDFHEPEAFQRSSVKNAVQWLDLKGSEKSYDIIGKISGYRVMAVGLWSLDGGIPASIPPSHIFELPAGSGHFFTDYEPLLPNLDEVGADVIPLDTYCWELSYQEPPGASPGQTWLSPPPTPAVPPGTSLSDAIGWTMRGTPIVSTTDLGGGRWRVVVGPAVDLTPIANIGLWYTTPEGMPDSQLWLETLPVETSPGIWSFEVLAGTLPAFGATVDLNYECRATSACGYCRASDIRVIVVPAEVTSDPEALSDGVLARLVKKILQVVPVHVRVTDIVHLVTVQIPLHMTITASGSPQVSVYAPLGYYFDTVPADELPVDPDHMIVSGTVFTVP